MAVLGGVAAGVAAAESGPVKEINPSEQEGQLACERAEGRAE